MLLRTLKASSIIGYFKVLRAFKLEIQAHHLMKRLNSSVASWLRMDRDVEDVAGDVDGLGQRAVGGQFGRMLVQMLFHFRWPSLHELVHVRHHVGIVDSRRWFLSGGKKL